MVSQNDSSKLLSQHVCVEITSSLHTSLILYIKKELAVKVNN